MIRALVVISFLAAVLGAAFLTLAGLFHVHHHLADVMSTYLGVPPGPASGLTLLAIVAFAATTYIVIIWYLEEEI